MNPEIMAAIKEERRRIARAGGLARAKKLSAKQLRASAVKASKAAARARSLKAKQKNVSTR
jgi:hypothetical protein